MERIERIKQMEDGIWNVLEESGRLDEIIKGNAR